MQITNQGKTVTRSHDFEEGGFTIEASPVMFEILSSRIYTDVPLAIVRELSTNAADSHVEAGNADKPFDVHLPSTFECHLSIRDYGTGLSRDEVEKVYTVFGASTRRDSNDFTGCLGLGSKTPFAYADQFTISSYRNGKKFIYSAFKNEENLPAISFMGEVDTDQPNGLEIHINIDPNDCHRFSEAARKVYQHFPVRPNIKGDSIYYQEADPIMEGEGWKLYDTRWFLPARISVLMGKIMYAANGSEITNVLGDNVYLSLEVEIGDCHIAGNREELQYDDHTNANLQRLVDEATAAIRQEIEDKLTNADCRLTRVMERMKYRNIIKLDDESASFKLNVDEPLPDNAPEGAVAKSKYGMFGLEVRRSGTSLSIDRSVEYIRPRDAHRKKFIFIENDLPQDEKLRAMHKRKIRCWLDAQGSAHSFLVTIVDRAAYLLEFGEPTIKLSELPEVPRDTATTSDGTNVPRSFIKVLREHEHRRQDREWINVEEAIDPEVSAAVPRTAYRIRWNGGDTDANTARKVAALIGVETVYGLSQSRYDKLAEKTGLESLEDKARAWVQNYVDNATDQTLALLMGTDRWGRMRGISDHIEHGLTNAMVPGMSDCVDDVLARRSETLPSPMIKTLIETFGITVPDVSLETVEAVAERFYDRYPLLKEISSYRVDKAAVAEYIALIEGKHAASATI
jgi:hypothetical protein